jgi:hypothetical protein
MNLEPYKLKVMHVMVHLCYVLTGIIRRSQRGIAPINGSDKDIDGYNDENINCIKVFIIDRHHIQNLKYSQSKVIDPVVTYSGQKYLATI